MATVGDYISAELIVSKAAEVVGDTSFTNGISERWFLSNLADGFRTICIESKSLKFYYDVPTSAQIKFPDKAFNLREVHLYDGDTCVPENSTKPLWKRTFSNMPNGKGNTSIINEFGSNGNTYLPNNRRSIGMIGSVYYYNVSNNNNNNASFVMLSDSCLSFKNTRLVFNSIGVELGNEPVIPAIFEQALIDYLEFCYFRVMKNRNPRKYRGLFADVKAELEKPYGNWKMAVKEAKSMDSAKRDDINRYISNMWHK